MALDKRLEGGEKEMVEKLLKKLFHEDILTGIVLGLLVGLHYDMSGLKPFLLILGLFMGLKLVAAK